MKHFTMLLVAALVSVATTLTLFELRGDQSAGSLEATVAPAFGEFEARVAHLEEAVERLIASPVALEPPAPRTAVGVPEGEHAALTDRLAELEARMDLAGGVAQVPRPTMAEMVRESHALFDEPRLGHDEATLTITDPAATVEQKLAAHEALRRVDDAYSNEMVAELVQIGETALDGEHRADVWRFFDGSSHLPQLAPHLRNALAHDTDPRARNEAAETLGNYASDPVNLEALRWAAEYDPDPGVRKKALRTLGDWSRLLADQGGE